MRDLLCHLSRFTVAALVALSTAVASAQTRPPDSVPSKMDLPPEVREWFRNPDGSCVQCSIGMCGVWCNVPAASTLLWDTPYGKAVRGGSWPDRVADYCERRQIKAFNITGETTWEWMEWAARTGRFKHGLFPHWIYQSQVRDGTAPRRDQSIIRRHLLFYAGSRDCQRYTDLKNSLALYRLVFGQPRQQDILEQVLAQQHTHNPYELNCALAKYMINLTPFGTEHAIRRANAEADRLLRSPEALLELLGDVPDQMMRIPEPVLREVQSKVDDLIMVAGGNRMPSDEESRRIALRAILYLLDPYDAVHDRHGIVGYSDDTAVIHEAHIAVFGSKPR